jgi:uncharacterized membrane protein
MSRFALVSTLSLLLTLPGVGGRGPLAAQTVRAVLFHSPTCPHCRQVISQDLPVFFQVYGGTPTVTEPGPDLALASNGRLEILFVDASLRTGGELYEASMVSHPVSRDRTGVPRMIIGDQVLVGSYEIPTRLHDIIRNGLANGGIDWPAIAGLPELVSRLTAVAAAPGGMATAAPPATEREAEPPSGAGTDTTEDATGPTPASRAAPPAIETTTGVAEEAATPTAAESLPAGPRLEDLGAARTASLGERFARDPVGNGLAVTTLILMVVILVAVLAGIPRRTGPREPRLWMPLLIFAGAVVSAYLAYVETTGTLAVCGPVGDCNTVQQSTYASLFGVIPIGLLGLVGYGFMLVLWVFGLEGRPGNGMARRLLFAATLSGAVFSVYLTFLEPFVIGATCLWCLSSAAIVTVLTWLSAAWAQHTPSQAG